MCVCVCYTEVLVSDSGHYTCLAVSETGETTWSSGLLVRHPSSPSTVFHRMPDASTFPGAPSRPSVSLAADTSVSLSWQPSDDHGASAVSAFTVEYFSQHSSTVKINLHYSVTTRLPCNILPGYYGDLDRLNNTSINQSIYLSRNPARDRTPRKDATSTNGCP